MPKNSNTHSIAALLTSSRFRIVRHAVLFLFIACISISFVWFMREDGHLQSLSGLISCLFSFIALFLGGTYLNIYVLTPRLLLKNRWGAYVGSLFGMVGLVLLCVILFQTFFAGKGVPTGEINLFALIVNTLSTVISLFLLFVGTTTLTLFKCWMQDMQQAEELESTTMQLELKLLENQINPHFLFNMLNNANIMIKADPDMAVHIIAKLEEMLRYQMNDSAREQVWLKEEIAFLNDYLELEKIRRDYFSYTIEQGDGLDGVQVPPLLFITFVENAVKHNQDSRTASYVHISFVIAAGKLVFFCKNSIPQKPSEKQVGGIGLTNIKRRLGLLYKNNYSLEQSKTDTSYTVKLVLKL